MPIVINDHPESTHPHTAICDYCGRFKGYLDDGYLKHSGYDKNSRPKFPMECDDCFKIIFGRLSVLDPIFIEEKTNPPAEDILSEEFNMSDETTTVRKTRVARKSVDELSASIDWVAMDALINQGKCKISLLEDQLEANPADLKNLFVAHYGDKIEFRRGRNGGVFWTSGAIDNTPVQTTCLL